MKRIVALFLSLLVFASLAACSAAENNDKKDFTSYIKKVQPAMKALDKSSQKYENVRSKAANGELSDAEFGEQLLNDVLPDYNDVQDKIEKITPPKKLRKTHEILLKAISKNNEGITEIISAIDEADFSKITSANTLLSEGRKAERDYVYKIQDTAEKYDLEFKN